MTAAALIFLATAFLAYTNGANDNFKGVATLFGSGTCDYNRAIRWATACTFFGSMASVIFAEALVKNFSGKGLVPDVVSSSPEFLIAVAAGAGLAVLIATVTGFPISTTHALTGSLVGGGLMAVGLEVDFARLGSVFLVPLVAGPIIAIILGAAFYMMFRCARVHMGIKKEWCLCVGETEEVVPMAEPGGAFAMSCALTPAASLDASVGTFDSCNERYKGRFLGVGLQDLVDTAHYISAGVVSFARGLNDTPKIVAILLAASAVGVQWGLLFVATGIAAGGLLSARKVAETMSKKITPMNHGQGFAANLATGLLVIFASRLGLPVSTTHVSVGSLFGIGIVTRRANTLVIGEILLSWVLTLPVAALLAAAVYFFLTI